LKNEDKLRPGNKNKQAYFALLSTCAIFAGDFLKKADVNK